MYSIVLMTAITAGSATPDFGRRGCHGCYSNANCYGACYGCTGGCYGRANCYGSCYGCYGSANCYGSCSGYVYGCSGCQGSSCHGCYGTVQSYGCTGGGCSGCHGCYGGHSCYGVSTSTSHHGGVILEKQKVMPPSDAPKGKRPATEEEDDDIQAVRAQLVLDLPADARLFVDGQLMKAGSGRRIFQTPNLQPGQAYFYDVRVEVVRNGQTLSDSQRVILQPGQQASASFAHLERQAEGSATVQVGNR